MRGTIKNIVLENFITYEFIELDPGVKMNMIIGPNGSGKSSILCGLCLGLGGKPKSIGRVTKLGDYVKTGCNQATIKIELNDNGQNVVIIRTISKEGGSSWSLNGKSSNQKQIEDTVSSMSIHMDNLCQFLSQERVQDFSKMNAKELLINTQLTVASKEMTNYHTQLIDMCKRNKNQGQTLNALRSNLERETQKCENLKARMESMKERLDLMEMIKNLKLKRPWILYNDHSKRFEELKADFKLAADNLKERKKELQPIEKAINTAKKKLTELSTEIRSTPVPGNALQTVLEAQEQHMHDMVKNQRHLRDQEKQEETRINLLKTTEKKYILCENSIQEHLANYDPNANQRKLQEITVESSKIDATLQKLTRTKQALALEGSEIDRELNDLSEERRQLTSVDQLRWDILKRTDNDAYHASRYVRDHKDDYPGLVFPSIMIEINMKNPNDGRYLEMLIPKQDKKALLCERPDDVNKLVVLLKERKLRINMLQAPNEAPKLNQTPHSEIRRYGFESFITDLFTCPLPVFNYLCRSKSLHLVPVAKTETQVNLAAAQNKFSRFFAGNKFFITNKSKYTGNSSVKVVNVTNYNSFSSSADANAVQTIEARETALKNRKVKVVEDYKEVQQKLANFEAGKETFREKRMSLKKESELLKQLQMEKDRIVVRISTYKKQASDLVSARAKCQNENRKLVSDLVKMLPKLMTMMKDAQANDISWNLKSLEERALRSKLIHKEQELREFRNTLKDIEKQADDLKKMVDDSKRQGQKMHKEAKEATGCAPGDPNFAKIDGIFKNLPDLVDDIDCAIKDNEGRLEFYGSDVNVNIVEEYNQQKKKVDGVNKELTNETKSLGNIKANMIRIKDLWLPQIRDLAHNISEKYSQLFAYMSCVGEVALIEGQIDVENDFENYGLQIRVKFREEEPLRDLGSAQSGGERSVSTAIYLLALQELTQVPFRCMDEINQGMDPTNERRIMNLMMTMSDSSESCQYFVVTPKLLPDLKYAKTSKVICVCQPEKFDVSKWKMSIFINQAKKMSGQKKVRPN